MSPGTRRFLNFLIFLGIIFTAISLILSYEVLEKNNTQISNLNSEIKKFETLIGSKWSSNNNLEQRIDTSILLLLNSELDTTTKNYVIPKIMDIDPLEINNTIDEDILVKDLLKYRDSFEKEVTAEIDELYINILGLKEEISILELQNNQFKIYALLFHIMGLMLILSRHMFE